LLLFVYEYEVQFNTHRFSTSVEQSPSDANTYSLTCLRNTVPVMECEVSLL